MIRSAPRYVVLLAASLLSVLTARAQYVDSTSIVYIDPGTGDISTTSEAFLEDGYDYYITLEAGLSRSGTVIAYDVSTDVDDVEIDLSGSVDLLNVTYQVSASASAYSVECSFDCMEIYGDSSDYSDVPDFPLISLQSIDTSGADLARFTFSINPPVLYSFTVGIEALGTYRIIPDPGSTAEVDFTPTALPSGTTTIQFAGSMYGHQAGSSDAAEIHRTDNISSNNYGATPVLCNLEREGQIILPVIVSFSHTVADVSTSFSYFPSASGLNTVVVSGLATVQSGSPSDAEIGALLETFSVSDSAGHTYSNQASSFQMGESVTAAVTWGGAWLQAQGSGSICNTYLMVVGDDGVILMSLPTSLGCLSVSLP
jgi:hypothetical protein